MFLVKKIICYTLVNPVFIVFVMALSSSKRKTFIPLALAFLIFSTPYISNMLLYPLERWEPVKKVDENVKFVVVLSGGAHRRKDLISSLGESSLKRLLEGVRICSHLKNCTLVLSGGSVLGSPRESESMGKVLDSLKRRAKVKMEGMSRDTYENALFVKRIVENSTFYLVTSAYHMKRSIFTFKKLGMNPIPAPCDFLMEKPTFSDYFPSWRGFKKSTIALHEYMGMLYYRLKEGLP